MGRAFDLGKGHRIGLSGAILASNNVTALNGGQSRDKAYSAKLYYGYQSGMIAYQTGISGLTGKNDAAGVLKTNILAIDFRFLLDPNYVNGYDYSSRFVLMGELLFNQREITSGNTNKATGFWMVADFQFVPPIM
ncbi:MAG: hypothetical protein IEMM0008_0330 [bacterium]|nr:MAG: hypothetical protein IEMM0008_0330 [bacterium]